MTRYALMTRVSLARCNYRSPNNMAGVAVVGSGNYELFIDTGFIYNGFTLDDATFLAF
jgi:hypothetical protein